MRAVNRLVFAAAFLGWLLCFGVMGMGMAVTSLDNALIVHAIAAPLIFASISAAYFSRVPTAAPTATALIFVAFVVSMDLVVVAILINRSLDMLASPLGTWIPFGLIFASTYVTGRVVRSRIRSVRSRASASQGMAG